MKKIKKILFSSLLLFSTTLLTGCPYDFDRYFSNNVTEQGSIYSLCMENPAFGVSLKKAFMEINVHQESTTTPLGTIGDALADVTQTLEVYNNLVESQKVTFILPFLQTVSLDLERYDKKSIELTYRTKDEEKMIKPLIKNGFLHTFTELDYQNISFEQMKNEVDFVENMPTTLYQYRVLFTSKNQDKRVYSFTSKKNEKNQPFFLIDDEHIQFQMKEDNENLEYQGLFTFPEGESVFYSNYDFSSKWSDKESLLEANLVSYENILLKQKEKWNIREDLLSSYIAKEYYLTQQNPSIIELFRIPNLNKEVLLHSCFLVYDDVLLKGNNELTTLEYNYLTSIERKMINQQESFLLNYIYEGFANFTKIDSHQLKISFVPEYKTKYALKSSRGLIEFDDISDDSFLGIASNSQEIMSSFSVFTKEKDDSSCAKSCTNGKWGIRYLFGCLFLVIYLLIDLSYRRKKSC